MPAKTPVRPTNLNSTSSITTLTFSADKLNKTPSKSLNIISWLFCSDKFRIDMPQYFQLALLGVIDLTPRYNQLIRLFYL